MKGRLRIDFESLLPLITLVILGIFINQAHCAPAIDDDDAEGGCYYMFNHYGEGDRILTNEPCLNCTCHNSMLMCYLRVCPFTKPIGQDCTIEKKPDQCCPVINCPEEDVRIHTDQKKLLVPVSLVTPSAPSSTTPATTSLAPISDSTDLAPYERGCEMNGKYYADGAQVEGDPSKPCELCYCIRNRTACVMQECILHVEGCEPVFQPGVCCPVRYRCDYPPQITDESSTIASVITTTIQSIFQTTPQPGGCFISGEYYADGSRIPGAERSPCEHCYCMRGEPVCAVQECGAPLENEAGNCTAVPPPPGHCCPEKFTCGDSEEVSADESVSTPMAIIGEATPTSDVVSADVSTDPPSSQVEDQTELLPARDGTTVAPIEPVDVGTPDDEAPAQADQPEEVASQTVPPTEATVADDKIESGPSTTSPVSEGDAPTASGVNQQDEDIVQTPTEASVPPTIFPAESQPISQDQPEIPTEPTIVPGATDAPVSQDDSSSSTSESILASSSTTESNDETIFGTTIQPEPIPSENLQRPSSEPSQDEPASSTSSSSSTPSAVPSEETSASTVRPEDIVTSARPVIEIIDMGSGSSEENMQPSETPVAPTEGQVSDDASRPSTETIPSEISPVDTITTESALAQDEESVGTTRAPATKDATESPDEPPMGDDNASVDATTVAPSQPGSPSVSQDESQLPITSERPSQDDSESESIGVTTQSPSAISDGGDEAVSGVSNDQPSVTEAANVPTIASPADAESEEPGQDAPATSSPSIVEEPATQSPQQDISTELPPSSSSSIDNDDAQQDKAGTTVRPESPITDAPSSPVVSDEVSQDSTEPGIPVTTSSPSSQQQQDESSTLLPITSERPLETEAPAADQPTTTRPNVLPDEVPEDNEIVSDQGGDSSSSISQTSEQPMAESSTENVVVTQPASSQQDEPATSASQQPIVEGTTVSSSGQFNDESAQSTPAPGSQDDDVPSVGVSTQASTESQTEASQQDASSQESGQSETEAPVDSSTSRPDSSPAPSQDEQSQTNEPVRDATAIPEGTTPLPVSDQDAPSETSQDQPENVEQDGSVSTVAPELSPERISTVPPPSNDESSVDQSSTPSAILDAQDSVTQQAQADSAQTVAPTVLPVSDDQAGQIQTTQRPVQEEAEDAIGQDEPVQTTPLSLPSADESVQPTTGRPSNLEASTETPIIQDEPESASPVQSPKEQATSAPEPDVTTIAPAQSGSQQVGSTEASSSETLGDEAVTESVTGLPPAVGIIQEDDSNALPAPTTQASEPASSSATESSGISSDQPGTTELPSPSADENSPQDSELPVAESSTSAPGTPDAGGEVIGVESVSNSPDGSESLSMMKTSTAAPPSSEGESSSSSIAPIDVAAPEDNEISSDGTSVEGEQSSSAPSVSSEPSSETSVPTSAPSTDSDESSSSSAPVSEISSSDDVDVTTPGVAPPISETSTETSSSSQSPDLDQPAAGINEIIPGTQQDDQNKISEQPEQVPVTTVGPEGDAVGTQEDEVPTTASPVSSSSQSVDGISDGVTTPPPQQQADDSQPGVSGSIGSTSSSLADEPSATTPATVPSQDDSSAPISSDTATTQRPTSVDDESSVAPPQSDDASSGGVSDSQTEPSAQDQGSSSSDSSEQESVPVTTSRPAGVESDDTQEIATEPIPVPAQPEDGISEVIQDQGGVVQGQTTPSSADAISGVKDQVVGVDEQSQGTTVQPEVGAIGVTSTIQPQEVSDNGQTELPVAGSDEPEISDQLAATTAAPASSQQEDEPSAPIAPITDDTQVPTTAAPIVADDGETPVADAKPSEDDEQVAVTTQQPSSDQQEIKDDQTPVTTGRPSVIAEGSTAEPVLDESNATSLPDSASADEAVIGTTAAPVADEPSVTSGPDSSSQADEAAPGTTVSPAGQPSEQQDQPTGTTESPVEQPSEQQDQAVGTTSSPVVQPSEQQDQSAGTTVSPAEQPSEQQDQSAGTTVSPVDQPSEQQDQSAGTTVLPAVQPSEQQQDESAGTTVSPAAQPSEQDQSSGDEPSVSITTVAPQSILQSTPDSISTETEVPEDSEEIRHPDDNTVDGADVEGSLEITTAQPEVSSPVAGESQTEGPSSQQDEGVTTQAPVQDEPSAGQELVSSQATTSRPEADMTTIASISQATSGPQADEVGTTERPSMITEQPISVQPESALGMMSSTEKVEMDSGSSTTESSGDEEGDSSTDSSVPGEGSCFVEGKTYRNGSSIPPTTPCHIACACKNSIVHCLLVHCPPPPARFVDCKPIYRSGVCCPDYDCGPTDEVSVTITPEPPFADNKDDTVFTVTPEATSTPSSESLVSQPQDNSERPSTESDIGIHDQPSQGGEATTPASSGDESGIVTTSASVSPSDQPSFPTTSLPPSEIVSSTDAPIGEAQQDSQQESTEPSAIATTTTASTTTSERPSDIEQIIDSSSSAPPEMAASGSDVAPEEDEQSSSTTGPPPGSQYPVTTTTTVTPSSAPWPYPTSSTPPPGAMSSGACLFDGRVYMSAQQIPREDPCDFCFCFRGDIICLQQSCPPPIPGCYEEPIPGFCCPRYECPVGNGNHTTPPPLFPPSYYHNQILNNAAGGSGQSGGSGMSGSVPSGPGCEIQGEYYETGQVITSTSGPCLECRCGSTGMMECDPRECQPEPMLRKMIAAITSRRR